MNHPLTVLFVVLVSVTRTYSQDCSLFYPETENAKLTYTQYSAKDKVTGSSVQQITGIRKGPASVEADISVENFDDKGKSLGSGKLTAKCENGIYFIDMKNYLNQESMESFEDMEIKIEGGSLELPSNPKAGEVLKNGNLSISVSSEGVAFMTMTISISNRKVEAVETITTPAGSFECYKISYDITTKMMMSIKARGVEWYARNIGLVRSESYSNDGKLAGYTVLTALSK